MRKSEELARRWMPGFRQGPGNRPAWMHPQDLVNLLTDMVSSTEGEYPIWTSFKDKHLDDIIDVCWTHDLIEDGRKEDGSPVTMQDLLDEGLPLLVVTSVVKLSHKPTETKEEYLASLKGSGWMIGVIKALDRICNLREGKDSFKAPRWERYVKETTTYVLPLLGNVPEPVKNWLTMRLIEARDARPL